MVPSNRVDAPSGLQQTTDRQERRTSGGGGHQVSSSPSPPLRATTTTAVTGAAILRSAVPCFVFLLVYGINDRIRILPRASDVHCVSLYNVSAVEVALLSVAPHRIVSAVDHVALDLLAALPYLLHYLIPVVFPVYLGVVARRPDQVRHFFRLLGCSMWAHYVIWFFLPTAPPWAFDGGGGGGGGRQGGEWDLEHREGCAFSRLDRWTGVPFFYTIFNGNPVPFASFPSGHVAWPMCVMMSLPAGTGRRGLFALYIVWVSWATMYSCHHYLLDILAAVVVTLLCQLAVGGSGNTRCSWASTGCNCRKRALKQSCFADVVVVAQ